MRFRGYQLLFLLCAVMALAARPARAAKSVNVQSFRPSPHSLDLIQVEGARVNHGYTATAYAMYNVAGRPMQPDVNLLGTLDILASVSFVDHISIGLAMPFHLHRGGDAQGLAGATVGDLRTSIKGAIVRPRQYGLGLALSFEVGVPTGQSGGLTAEAGATFRPRLILEGTNRWLHTALNIAYLARLEERTRVVAGETMTSADELQFLLGFGLNLGIPEVQLIVEVDFASRVERMYAAGSTRLELYGGLRYRLPYGLAMQAGAGGGLIDSYFHGFGEPSWRFFASLGYMPATFAPEPVVIVDPCPWKPEGFEGPMDAEGCPLPDSDGDGVCDPWVTLVGASELFADACRGVDVCPDLAGDQPDGCPHPDRDGDRICCPWVSERGLLDHYAHICTGVDRCPDDPEDYDGFEDTDGCPDPDNDGDGICDPWVALAGQSEKYAQICRGSDRCPDEYGEGEDGCPVVVDPCAEPGSVCVTDEQIVIKDTIYFATNRARIRPVSFPLLERIAEVMQAHPEIELIEIQGHTDSRGRAAYNLRLSQQRADAVRDHLVKRHGISPARLVTRGYGMTRAIADNDTEEGRAANRRVEFHILRRGQ
jgi:outer membrane protein OmpA-like peptidoglycan-associated protein